MNSEAAFELESTTTEMFEPFGEDLGLHNCFKHRTTNQVVRKTGEFLNGGSVPVYDEVGFYNPVTNQVEVTDDSDDSDDDEDHEDGVAGVN